MMGLTEDRMLSRPVDVHWAGWRTNTYALQQQGWSLSAEQSFERMTMRLAMRNERLGIVGITGDVPWEYMRHAHEPLCPLPTLPVQLMSRKIEVLHEAGYMADFRPIDAQPVVVSHKRTSLEDFAHFAPALVRTQQLIVPEETVDDLMQRILEMQKGPRIERIRQEIREGERVRWEPQQKFHAQIISLAA